MALSKQVTVIYPVIFAKPHQPVSFELDLNVDFTYLVNFNFSLHCVHFVNTNQLFYVHFGRASIASEDQNSNNFQWEHAPRPPLELHAARVILKVNWTDHSKIASSGSVSSLDFSAVLLCRGVPVGVVYVGNNAVFTSEVVLRQNQAGS